MGVVEDFLKLKGVDKLNQLKIWDQHYYNEDNPLITDEEYDECLRLYNAKYKNKYESSLGNSSSRFTQYEHTYPVLSLEKVVTEEGFVKGAEAFDFNCVLEPKLDGLTVVYYPDGKLVSRGNGHVGEVLNEDRVIPNLPAPYDYPIRLEAVITKSTFDTYFKKSSKKARNLAAGILRRKEKENKASDKSTEDIKHLTFYAYNILGADDMTETEQMAKLKELGFTVPEVLVIKDKESIMKAFQNMEEWSKDQDYWTDGVVIKANIAKNEKDFGMTAHHPNNAFAFKFVSMIKETTLIDVDWNLGYDKYTPVAVFETVILGGSEVRRASMHNLNIMANLGVKLGSRVSVTLKNEIIPQIVACDGQGTAIEVPKICKVCGSPLIINSTQEVICPNPACEGKIMDTLKRIVSKQGFDIEGIGKDRLPVVFEEIKRQNIDISNPFAFFSLDKDIFVRAFTGKQAADGMKRRKKKEDSEGDLFAQETESEEKVTELSYSATKVYIEVQNKRKNIAPDKFLFCCNIDELGINTAKLIMQHFKDLEDLLAHWDTVIEYTDKNGKVVEMPKGRTIDGVGEVTYSSLSSSLERIKSYMQYVTIGANNNYVDTSAPVEAGKEKLKFCISGALTQKKSYYEKIILDAGHLYMTSVTKDLSYLVTKEEGTSKVVKAQKYGIPVIGEEELLEILKK